MTLCCGRRTKGACALLALVSLVVVVVLSATTSHEVCETLNGHQCHKDVTHCSGDDKCYCPEDESKSDADTCIAAERKWDWEIARVVVDVFGFLFIVSFAVLILSCMCGCNRENGCDGSSTYGRGGFDGGGGDCGGGDGGGGA